MKPKKEKKNEMTPEVEVEDSPVEEKTEGNAENEVEVPKLLDSAEVKPKQPFLNLDTLEEDDIEIKHKRYSLTKDGEKPEWAEEVIAQLVNLVPDKAELARALLYGVNNALYTAGKNAALDGGNYLQSELQSKIVATVKATNPTLTKAKSSKVFEMWEAAYRAKKASAIAILKMVRGDDNPFAL